MEAIKEISDKFKQEQKKFPPGETPDLDNIVIGNPYNDLFYFKMYIRECMEIFVFYVAYAYLTENKDFSIFKAIKVSLVLGGLSLMLEFYNSSLKKNMKNGFVASFGGLLKM
jgi:hypothetical protein